MLDAVARFPQSFVGRSPPNCISVQAILNSVLGTRRPQFALVEGEFGAGKTALVEHFLVKVAAEIPLIGRAKCAMETERNGLTPFTLLLKNMLKSAEEQKFLPGSMEEFLERVAPAWLDVFAVESREEAFSGVVRPGKSDDISLASN